MAARLTRDDRSVANRFGPRPRCLATLSKIYSISRGVTALAGITYFGEAAPLDSRTTNSPQRGIRGGAAVPSIVYRPGIGVPDTCRVATAAVSPPQQRPSHRTEKPMTLYEYTCHTHGAFESMHRLGEAPPDASCPVCGGTARRVISAPVVISARRAALFSAVERSEKSRHDPELVTSIPPSGAPRRQVSMTPELWKLPRP